MPEHVLELGGYAPRASSHSDALALFGDLVERGTDGRVKVNVLWNILDRGLPASALLEMVEAGELSMCYFSTSYLGDRVPLLNILEAPFLFPDLEQAHRALDGAFGAALSAATLAATGMMVLGYWDNGFRHLTNRLRPIRAAVDLAGMRVRIQPNAIHHALIEAWGAVPVGVDLSRGVELIASGEVDAQENPLANTVAYGVDRVHRFATMTGHLYGARGLYGHVGTFDLLSQVHRAVVDDAARQAIVFQRQAAAKNEQVLRERLEAQGMQFVDLTADERAEFVAAAAPVVEALRSEFGQDLVNLAAQA